MRAHFCGCLLFVCSCCHKLHYIDCTSLPFNRADYGSCMNDRQKFTTRGPARGGPSRDTASHTPGRLPKGFLLLCFSLSQDTISLSVHCVCWRIFLRFLLLFSEPPSQTATSDLDLWKLDYVNLVLMDSGLYLWVSKTNIRSSLEICSMKKHCLSIFSSAWAWVSKTIGIPRQQFQSGHEVPITWAPSWSPGYILVPAVCPICYQVAS